MAVLQFEAQLFEFHVVLCTDKSEAKDLCWIWLEIDQPLDVVFLLQCWLVKAVK